MPGRRLRTDLGSLISRSDGTQQLKHTYDETTMLREGEMLFPVILPQVVFSSSTPLPDFFLIFLAFHHFFSFCSKSNISQQYVHFYQNTIFLLLFILFFFVTKHVQAV